MINKLTLNSKDYPDRLQQIPSAPKELYHSGAPLRDLLERPAVAIVGTRGVTAYGTQVTIELAKRLAEQGIVIISGLAIGVDGLAHRAALEVGGLTIAVLPGPLNDIIPHSNRRLAEQIIAEGGALVSEYETGTIPQKQNFIARNRIVTGLADAVVVTEASDNSGTLHTARFAIDQQRELLAVPGNITSHASHTTNNLIKNSKASLITSFEDVLEILGLQTKAKRRRAIKGRTTHEQIIIDLMQQGARRGEELIAQSGLSATEFNTALTMLEINNKVRPLGANNWAIY